MTFRVADRVTLQTEAWENLLFLMFFFLTFFFDKVSARVLFGAVSLVVPHLVAVAVVGLCLHPRDRFSLSLCCHLLDHWFQQIRYPFAVSQHHKTPGWSLSFNRLTLVACTSLTCLGTTWRSDLWVFCSLPIN